MRPAYNDHIRPILSDKCFACHGPDKANQKGDLRLDVRDAAIKAGAIVPGDPDASELIKRVIDHDPDEVMPPPEAKLGTLTTAEIDTLRQWIKDGAEYEPHWAFLPVPVKVPVPDAGLRKELVRNPVDAFVFEGLQKRGLEPRPEANRATLLRRVTFDLTGLPPTPEEIAAFLADQEPGAYERVVDRLLASPAYGERMAVDWLDLARYADSYGHQVDKDRFVWPWRDWVVGAFNRNLSYKDFITWQLAGDLLENPTDEQVLATTFSRLHQQESEGGSVEEEYRVEYVADRVATFGTAFLGLTLDCARCHDHKFDPVSQKDYYSFFAFFQNIDEAGLYSYFTDSAPTPAMPLMNGKQKEELADLNAAVDEALKSTTSPTRGTGGDLAWFRFDRIVPKENAVAGGKALEIKGDNQLVDGPDGGAVALTGDDPLILPIGNFERWEPFSVGLRMKTPDVKERAVVFHRSKAWTDAASRGYELLLEDGRLKWSLIHFWPGNAISIKAKEPLAVNEWAQVTVTYDGSSRADGLAIYLNGKKLATEVIRDGLTRQIQGGGGDTISIGERMRDRGFKGGMIDDFRVIARELSADEVMGLIGGNSFASQVNDREVFLAAAREKRDRFRDSVKEIMVMRELPQPKKAYLLERGAYASRGEEVGMRLPDFLPPMPEGAPVNRLGLARWLTDRSHPLTSRTAVNRFWQACFGRGLVETTEDFGSQGTKPRYPELLDWLSAGFMDSGWDVKWLMRTIVTSHVYRQDSLGTPEAMRDDPANDWLSRGPRFRLPAEMIRDNALAVSGLLAGKSGGPPVKPYEIEESFKPSKPDQGEGLYRRSLYTYWRTTGPAPAMLTFDAVKRDVCTVRRDVTTTPLQSLVVLNGTQYVEASRVLGEKLVRESSGSPEEIVRRAFLTLTGREPDAREQGILGKLHRDELEAFKAEPEKAKQFLTTGASPPDPKLDPADVAAAGVLVNALLDYDGSVVRR